jgi:hypothetical protein
MALTDELQNHARLLEQNTQAVRDLVSLLQRQLQGGTASGNAQGASVGAQANVGAAQGFWSDAMKNVKHSSAEGRGLSAMRTFLSSAGANTAAGIVGGFAGGPIAGSLNAAATVAGMAFQGNMSPLNAGNNAFNNAMNTGSPFRSEMSTFREAQLRGNVAESRDETGQSWRAMRRMFMDDEGNGPSPTGVKGGGLGGLLFDMGLKAFGSRMGDARKTRKAQGDLEEFLVRDDVEQRVERFFRPFAVAGATPESKDIEAMAKFFKMQADASFKIHKDTQDVVSKLMMSPGNAGQQGKR